MILTVTPNTALDKVIFVDDFTLGRTSRATATAEGMGGKGAVTSWVLGQLGIPSTAMGFAAGQTGRRMEGLLRDVGVETDFTWVDGDTRTNYVLARNRDGLQGTVTVSGLQPSLEDAQRLQEAVLDRLGSAKFLLCGGSLPPGMPAEWYAPLIEQARQRGVVSLLDASDRVLAANLDAKPDIIKPNADEASALLNTTVNDVPTAYEAARALRARGVNTVCVTLGSQGAVADTVDGGFFVPPVDVQVVNTAGAGDGFNAGLIMARRRECDWREALRLAVAVATAILVTPGTGVCRMKDVQDILPSVDVERL